MGKTTQTKTMTDKEKIAALHDKIETVKGDLEGLACFFGCNSVKDGDFLEQVTLDGLVEAGLTHEDSTLFMALATESNYDSIREIAHYIYWEAK